MIGKLEEFGALTFAFFLYPIIAFLLSRIGTSFKSTLFAWLNVASCYCIALLTLAPRWRFDSHLRSEFFTYGSVLFGIYLFSVLVNYLALVRSERSANWNTAAYLLPIAFLVGFKCLQKVLYLHPAIVIEICVGVSYLSFRLSHLVSEVKNKIVPMPTVAEYFAYAYFPPIMFVGPITPYSGFASSLNSSRLVPIEPTKAITRILIGVVKCVFLSAVLSELGYGAAFLLDGHPHAKIDLVLAIVIYPLFLFVNFSGMCDLAIGASALIGISVIENFDKPFSARNLREFWTRWHISLTNWLRDMVFTPFVKSATRVVGIEKINHVATVGILLVFLIMGVWHGSQMNFVLFGMSQGIGVSINHYGNIWLRKLLTKEQYRKYFANRVCYGSAVAFTYAYFALSLFLFANTTDQMRQIFHHIQ